jgi:dihydrofolate reductase
MRRFVYYVAASADGFIARANGSVDWLDERPAAEYDFAEFTARVDTIVWGRKTYEQGLEKGGLAPFGDKVRHVVLSRRPSADPLFTTDGPRALADRLRAEPGRDVWIMGGAELAASFLDAGALIPVLLGEGIPLFAPRERNAPLRLVDSHAYKDGVLRLRYEVTRSRP